MMIFVCDKDGIIGTDQSEVKQMMILVYDKDGIIVTDPVPNGITMTAAYYQKVIIS